MKRIGLLGGMSWESSLEYYRNINELVKDKLGGTHSADCLMYSFDFHLVEELQHQGKWAELTDLMVTESVNLKKAGAECLVICTNTMHKMAGDIEVATKLPLIHIADATADAICKKGLDQVLLLGTKFTMGGDFYKDRLALKGIKTIVPSEEDQEVIHNIIYNELILGEIKDVSKKTYCSIIEKYKEVQGVVLGCTEIPLLVKEGDVSIPVFDTTWIHSEAVVEYACQK